MDTIKHERMLIDKEKNFEEVFRTYFKELHRYAFKILSDADTAEEAVQQIFLKLWEKDLQLDIHTSIRSYLYRAVHNESINLLKKEQHQVHYQIHQQYALRNEAYSQQNDVELRQQLHEALAQLPDKSRVVFEMSRFQDLKYHEIADQLTISLKTVEGHMTKALRHLRVHLAEYLNVLTLLILAR